MRVEQLIEWSERGKSRHVDLKQTRRTVISFEVNFVECCGYNLSPTIPICTCNYNTYILGIFTGECESERDIYIYREHDKK